MEVPLNVAIDLEKNIIYFVFYKILYFPHFSVCSLFCISRFTSKHTWIIS